MSLLLDHGHRHAHRYPVGKVQVEVDIVMERVQALEGQSAVLTQMAVASLFSKEGSEAFTEKLKTM